MMFISAYKSGLKKHGLWKIMLSCLTFLCIALWGFAQSSCRIQLRKNVCSTASRDFEQIYL